MLCEIRIENFAIIERLEVHFDEGFNFITGETGAGKSIIIDAVDLLLGGRADTDFVRAGAERAVIEGVFKIPKFLHNEIMPLLDTESIDRGDHPDEIVLTRELRSNDRNTRRNKCTNAYLNPCRILDRTLSS